MAYIEKRGNTYRVRYLSDDGTWASQSGFPTKESAENYAADLETDQRRGQFFDPRGGDTTLSEWVEAWWEAHDVGAATAAKYRTFIDRHIEPRFGRLPLRSITRLAVKGWVKQLRTTHAESSVASIFALLSTILGEAVEERLIPANPCRGIRVTTGQQEERPHATAEQVMQIAERAGMHGVMVITAAYTGMRWGELAGLRRDNCQLLRKTLLVRESLHEVAGRLELGPPKTAASVRDILLPDFLVTMLAAHLTTHDNEHVFIGRDGGLLRRSAFARRVWRPALDGRPETKPKKGKPKPAVPAILAGMHFHDLRHTHKTWLIEDGVPEVAQARRLGHRMAGIAGVYSHVTGEVERRLVDALQARWERSSPISLPFDLGELEA